jgi:hypothetical protein
LQYRVYSGKISGRRALTALVRIHQEPTSTTLQRRPYR